jgi:hypothetical protein
MIANEVMEILDNPTYVELLLCIIRGKNYSMAISRTLEKKQPTVTEQLRHLEKAGLIQPLKRKKAQCYDVEWDLLFSVFYHIVRNLLDLGEDYFSREDIETAKQIGERYLHEIVPQDLFKGFLKEYFYVLREHRGKKKGFYEIVLAFLSAINELNESDWKKLGKSFRIDRKSLSFLASVAGFEMHAVEHVALTVFLNS